MTLPTGTVEAQLAFKRCGSLDLALLDAGNTTLGGLSGPSVVSMGAIVPSGDYAYTVGGGRCSFTLTITSTPTG